MKGQKKGRIDHSDPSIEKLWTLSAGIELPPAENKAQAWAALSQRLDESPSGHRLFWPWLPGLAVVAILLVAVYGYRLMMPTVLATARAVTQTHTLDDGTQIMLNAATEIRIERGFNYSHRRIHLKGEAFFVVQPGQEPFVVQTEVANITVVGTEFNVSQRQGRLLVGVREGSVRVSADTEQGLRQVLLKRGEQSLCLAGQAPILFDPIQAEQLPQWEDRRLHVQALPLRLVCDEIELRFDVAIDIEDAELGETSVTGLFSGASAESMITALCVLIDRSYDRDGDRFIIR